MSRLWSPTVARLGVRGLLGRRRGVLLLVLPLVLLGLSILVRALVGADQEAASATLYGLGLGVVVPLVALLATSGLLAPEIDDGSIVHLLATPVARPAIVLSKLAVAAAVVLAGAGLPVLVAGLVMLPGSPRFALGFALAAVLGGLAYCGLFALLSVLTRHAVVVGLVYLLVWEGLVGGLLDGVRWLSITRWSAAVAEPLAQVVLVNDLGPTYGGIALGVVIVLGAWGTGQRLRGFALTGDE